MGAINIEDRFNKALDQAKELIVEMNNMTIEEFNVRYRNDRRFYNGVRIIVELIMKSN